MLLCLPWVYPNVFFKVCSTLPNLPTYSFGTGVSLPFAPTSLSEKADISYFNVTLDAGDGSLASGQFVGEVNGAVGAEIRVYATDQTSLQSDSANSMDASCSVGISGFYYSA